MCGSLENEQTLFTKHKTADFEHFFKNSRHRNPNLAACKISASWINSSALLHSAFD